MLLSSTESENEKLLTTDRLSLNIHTSSDIVTPTILTLYNKPYAISKAVFNTVNSVVKVDDSTVFY